MIIRHSQSTFHCDQENIFRDENESNQCAPEPRCIAVSSLDDSLSAHLAPKIGSSGWNHRTARSAIGLPRWLWPAEPYDIEKMFARHKGVVWPKEPIVLMPEACAACLQYSLTVSKCMAARSCSNPVATLHRHKAHEVRVKA